MVCLLATFGVSAGQPETTRAQVAERPNIIFIMTDDMSKHHLSAMPTVRKEILGKGATFENAYVTQSLCCPSRASFLRGQYPHNHLVTSNFAPDGAEPKFRRLGRDQSTAATWLQGSGYRTAFVGKYMNAMNGSYVPPGWSGWWGRTGASRDRLMNENGKVRRLPEGHMTDIYRSRAVGFLNRSTDRASDPPFMLFAWTNAPHLPANSANRHEKLYRNAKLPRPPSFNEADVSDKPRWVRSQPRLTPARIRNMQNQYRNQLRSLRAVDEMVAASLRLLRQRGEMDNTYIVFASDHGVHMGEHRYFGARGAKSTPYSEAAKIPLAIRGPGIRPGMVRDELVTNNDLAPTLADIAGAESDDFVDGQSLKPLWGGTQPEEWRTAILNERHLTQRDDLPVPNYDSVITKDHTYVNYETGEKELYDHKADPFQINSIHETADPELTSSLEERMEALKTCAVEACREAEAVSPEGVHPPRQVARPNTPPAITRPSPRPGSKIKNRKPRISATARDMQTQLTKRNIRLYFDGRRTAKFSYNPRGDRLVYKPRRPLSLGRHTVRVIAIDEAGRRSAKAWGFKVVKRR